MGIDPININSKEYKTLFKILTYHSCPKCNYKQIKYFYSDIMEVPNCNLFICECPNCEFSFLIGKLMRNTSEYEQSRPIDPYHFEYPLQLGLPGYKVYVYYGIDKTTDYHTLLFNDIVIKFNLNLIQVLSLSKYYK